MSRSLIDKLSAVTVERGATPAEESNAKAMLQRLTAGQQRQSAEALRRSQNRTAQAMARAFGSPPVRPVIHQWGERVDMLPPYRWCQTCQNCGMIRTTGRRPDGEWFHEFFGSDGEGVGPPSNATLCRI